MAPGPLDPVDVHSSLDGPIEGLSFLQKSLLFAELSELSYLSRAEAGRLCNHIGLPEIRFYDREGAQAYIFGNDTDVVVTCRGTEPNDWNDIRADLSLGKVMAETVGKVHRGFKTEVDDLWPRLEQALVNNTRTAWFAGHSLGAAMATICAGRCKVSQIRTDPRAVFTYGSPRVGNKRYVQYLNIELYRWVHNNDIVTRVPPRWLGYSHKGAGSLSERLRPDSPAHEVAADERSLARIYPRTQARRVRFLFRPLDQQLCETHSGVGRRGTGGDADGSAVCATGAIAILADYASAAAAGGVGTASSG